MAFGGVAFPVLADAVLPAGRFFGATIIVLTAVFQIIRFALTMIDVLIFCALNRRAIISVVIISCAFGHVRWAHLVLKILSIVTYVAGFCRAGRFLDIRKLAIYAVGWAAIAIMVDIVKRAAAQNGNE